MKIRTVYDLKPAFQSLLRPVTNALARSGVTANQVTMAALLLSVLQGLWIWVQPDSRLALLFLPLVLFIRMALNAIDGMLAREHNQKTRLGAVLNELGDVISDTVLYLPFVRHPDLNAHLVAAFVFLAILTEFTGVLIQAVSGHRPYYGPMGKSDRALLSGAIAFLGALGVGYGTWTNALLALAVALLLWTVRNRLLRGLAA